MKRFNISPRFHKGDQAADEEGVHPGILQRQEVHVSVLLPVQVSQSSCGKQDVRQGECVTQSASGLQPKRATHKE